MEINLINFIIVEQMNPMIELQEAFNLVSNPNTQSIRNGEALLKKLKTNNINYPMFLLNYMKENNNFEGKLRAAIELRIWTEDYKGFEEFQRQYFKGIIEEVKSNILLAYLGYSGKIQKTLLPGIVALSVVEFPDNWQGLVSGLIQFCREDDNSSTLKVLELLKQITQKYNYLSRSDPLYRQINFVCDALHDFLFSLTEKLVANFVNVQHIPENISILQQLMRLFYNLNYQDIHPKFEDNLRNWMNILNEVMKLPNSNENFFKCKGAALESILLYASKYKEDVEDSIKGFSQLIWNLCASAVSDPEYDDIVFNSLKYFRSLILWSDMKEFFQNNIESLIQNLILPNISINKNSMDLFEEENQTFIAYYFRNAEIGTRRAAALQLLRAICRNFSKFEPFIEQQVRGYSPENSNIENECLLLNLVMESAAKAFRDVDGVTQSSINQNIINYCYHSIVKNRLNQFYTIFEGKENLLENNFNLMHVVIILRYIFYFRIFLPKEDLVLILKLCCSMKTNKQPMKSVIFLVINGFITIRHGDFKFYKDLYPYFNADTLSTVTTNVLTLVYENEQIQNKLNENLTKILYNMAKHLGKGCILFYDHFSFILDSMLKKTAQYDFASISGLFEAMGIISYWMCVEKAEKMYDMEDKVYKYFEKAIQSDSDIVNFCFQVLSIFARFSQNQAARYNNIYKSILSPNNWTQENLSVMSSYVHYISVYVKLNPQALLDDKNAICSLLLRMVELDRYELFYRLLNDILKITNLNGFVDSGYFGLCINSSAQILQKSQMATKTVLSFIFNITWNYQIEGVIAYINKYINNFYEQCLLHNQSLIQTIQARKERKLMYGSICNALVTGCFSSIENQGTLLNLLIDNSTGRFRFQKLSESIKEKEIQQKKQSSFKKLQILKLMEENEPDVSIDEQKILLKAYTLSVQRSPDLLSFITPNNQERINRLQNKLGDA